MVGASTRGYTDSSSRLPLSCNGWVPVLVSMGPRVVGPATLRRLQASSELRLLGRHGRRHEPNPRHPQPVNLFDPQTLIACRNLIAKVSRPTQTGEDVAAEGFDVDPLSGQVQVVALAQLNERDESVQRQAAIGCRAFG